jgi:hypothetical protein
MCESAETNYESRAELYRDSDQTLHIKGRGVEAQMSGSVEAGREIYQTNPVFISADLCLFPGRTSTWLKAAQACEGNLRTMLPI